MLELKRFEDVRAFYSQVEAFLVEHEAEHNLLLGLCTTLMLTDTYRDQPYMAYMADGERVVGLALRTPPNNLIVSLMKDDAALRLIAEDAYAVYGSELRGVTGPQVSSKPFAAEWQAVTGIGHRLKMAQGTYKLEAVTHPTGIAGEMRPAQSEQRDLLVQWMSDFAAEAVDPIPVEEAERNIDIRLESDPALRGLRLWWDAGQPVSLAGYGGRTPNGMRIGPVYTPPALRKRGYASALTAALSQELLDSGRKFCFLFTDLANPTSNRIYQQIGYQAVCDVDEYRFVVAP
jgi:hypothetical protein